jgi:hypothetical protein
MKFVLDNGTQIEQRVDIFRVKSRGLSSIIHIVPAIEPSGRRTGQPA